MAWRNRHGVRVPCGVRAVWMRQGRPLALRQPLPCVRMGITSRLEGRLAEVLSCSARLASRRL
jgi:hypothetical protein